MRNLTEREAAVLAHVVDDAAAWWANAQTVLGAGAEPALAAKLARWAPAYDAAVARLADDYKPRAAREAAAAAARPAPPTPGERLAAELAAAPLLDALVTALEAKGIVTRAALLAAAAGAS